MLGIKRNSVLGVALLLVISIGAYFVMNLVLPRYPFLFINKEISASEMAEIADPNSERYAITIYGDDEALSFGRYIVKGKSNVASVKSKLSEEYGFIRNYNYGNKSLFHNVPWSLTDDGFYPILFGVFILIPALFGTASGKEKSSSKNASATSTSPVVMYSNGTQTSNVKAENRNDVTTFSDVAGYAETKRSLEFIVNCLKNPEILRKAGAKIPKGIILYGPPGTGKTFMAKAIAGTAGVKFYSANASSFINTYVGTGAANIRDLFAEASKSGRAVVFIDELDAIGRQRGNSDNSEYRNTINALLAEIDGINSNSNIIVIAATNDIDSLDEALLRPGRFDRKVYIPLPNRNDRYQILSQYAKNKTIRGISIDEVARDTEGLSCSALATLLNEAAIKAAENGRTVIQKDDILTSLHQMVTFSDDREALSGEEGLLAAYHEAGHVLILKKLCGKSIPRVSIYTSSTGDNGNTMFTSGGGVHTTRKDLEHQIMGFYGGRAAEEIHLGGTDNITAGSSSDLKEATKLIKKYLSEFGMGDGNLINTAELYGNNSVNMEEAQKLASRLYQATLDFLKTNRSSLDRLSKALYERKSLDNAEIERLI